MADSKLHKEKGKTRRGIYGDDVPEIVTRYFDRKCGKIDDKVERNEKREKEWTRKSKQCPPMQVYEGMEEDYALTDEDLDYENKDN